MAWFNGVSRITLGQNSAHPLYFGGDLTAENMGGKLDDIAILVEHPAGLQRGRNWRRVL
jgi:hypothetical protein